MNTSLLFQEATQKVRENDFPTFTNQMLTDNFIKITFYSDKESKEMWNFLFLMEELEKYAQAVDVDTDNIVKYSTFTKTRLTIQDKGTFICLALIQKSNSRRLQKRNKKHGII